MLYELWCCGLVMGVYPNLEVATMMATYLSNQTGRAVHIK